MKSYRGLSLTFLALLAAVTVLFFITVHKDYGVASRRPHMRKPAEFDKFNATGVSALTYEKGKMNFSLGADSVVHRKRRTELFVYQNLREIYVSNLKLNAYVGNSNPSSDGKAAVLPLDDMLDTLVMLNGSRTSQEEYLTGNPDPDLSFLSRFVIDGLAMNIHLRDGKMVVIAARRATINPDCKNLVFEETLRVLFPDGVELTAPEGVWSGEFKGIYLPKGYLFRKDYHRERAFFRIADDGRFLQALQIPNVKYTDVLTENEKILYSNISGRIPAAAAFALGLRKD